MGKVVAVVNPVSELGWKVVEGVVNVLKGKLAESIVTRLFDFISRALGCIDPVVVHDFYGCTGSDIRSCVKDIVWLLLNHHPHVVPGCASVERRDRVTLTERDCIVSYSGCTRHAGGIVSEVFSNLKLMARCHVADHARRVNSRFFAEMVWELAKLSMCLKELGAKDKGADYAFICNGFVALVEVKTSLRKAAEQEGAVKECLLRVQPRRVRYYILYMDVDISPRIGNATLYEVSHL